MNLKNILLLSAIIFGLQIIEAQKLNWIYKIGGLTAETGIALSQDLNGNIYDITNFMGTVAVSNNISFTSSGNGDIIIRKSSSFGALLWAKKLGGTKSDAAYDIVSDDTGNIYVVGTFQDTLRLQNQIVLIGNDKQDGFILHLNTDGDFIKALRLASSISASVKSVSLDQTGNIYVSGNFEGTLDADPFENVSLLNSAGNFDFFIIKYSPVGNLMWAHKIGGSETEIVHKHISDDQGNLYLTGEYRNMLDFDPSTEIAFLTPRGMTDCFLLKLNSDGEYMWAHSYGGTGFDSGYGIALDPDDNVLLTGRFANDVDFHSGGTAVILTSNGSWDAFVLKLNKDGNFIWVKSLGGKMNDQGKSIKTNSTGVIFVSGTFRDTVDFDPNPLSEKLSYSKGGDDIFYVVLNQDGTYNDHFVIGGQANDLVNDIMVKTNGDLVSVGGFGAIVDFDPSPEVINIFSTGGLDAFMLNFFICVNPYIKEINIPDSHICFGERGLVQIAEAYLNGASQWSWQRNSCTNITFASGDFLDLPLTQNTTYFIKGSGGCVTKNDCVEAGIRVFRDTLNYRILDICSGDTVFVGPNAYTTNGVYIDSLQSTAGCDSVVITELNVFPRYIITNSYSICQGDTVKVDGSNYTLTGVYLNAYKTVDGCDSIIVSSVNVIPSLIEMQDVELCQGDTFTIGNEVYSTTGTYILTTLSDQGCENFLITNLTVIPVEYNQILSLCAGDSIIVGSSVYKEEGVYTDFLGSSKGCDSIVTSVIIKYPVFNSQQVIEICDGDSIQIGNNVHFSSGIYSDTLQSIHGCDSIIITDLRVFPVPDIFEVYVDLCEGQSWQAGNNIYTETGTYTDTIQLSNGCDSLIISNVRVQQSKFFQIVDICFGERYEIGDSVYTISGIYTNEFESSSGCDSIYITTLNVIPLSEILQNITICPGDTIRIGENNYSDAGLYIDTLTSLRTGCDSVIFTNINFHPITFKHEISICQGDSIIIGSNAYNTNGVYIDSLISSFGCDSILITTLFVLDPSTKISASVCEGTGYEVGNNIYFESGEYIDSLISKFGCDSIVFTTLEVIPILRTEGFFELCKGDSITIANITYYDSATHIDTLFSINGCDSSITRIGLQFLEIDNDIDTTGSTLSAVLVENALYQWVDCKNNFSIISGAESHIFEPVQSGTYAVEISLRACKVISECIDFIPTSTKDPLGDHFRFYPNPTLGIVHIEAKGTYKLTISDGNGRIIEEMNGSEGLNSLNFSYLSSGYYTLKVQMQNKTAFYKLVKAQ